MGFKGFRVRKDQKETREMLVLMDPLELKEPRGNQEPMG